MQSPTHLDTNLSSTHSCPCSAPDLHCTLCQHYNPSLYSWYPFGLGYLGTSHHVIMDLAALDLHAPYTTSDSVIISDDSNLSIANIGSLSLSSLPTPLFFFLNFYMWLPCLRILFRSRLFVPITLLMSYSLTLSFRCRIITLGSPWFAGSLEMVSITSQSQSPFSLQP